MNPKPEHRWFDGLPERYVVAHRGAAGHRPENTLESFRHALKIGADVLELDIHLTADRHLVATHDPSVSRVTDGHDPVREVTLQALQSLDAGYRYTADRGGSYPWRGKGVRIPTLREILDEFPHTRLVIEIKPNDHAISEALAELLIELNVQHRVLVGSFHDDLLRDFRKRAPGYATCAGRREIRHLVLRAYAGWTRGMTVPYEAFIVPQAWGHWPVATRRVIRQVRALGLHVHVWTVNDPDIMRKLYQIGVHAMTTDFPDRARAVLDALTL